MSTRCFITTSLIDGCHYPQKIQSNLIRYYCDNEGLHFSLPITEQIGNEKVFVDQVLGGNPDQLIVFSLNSLKILNRTSLLKLKESMAKGLRVHGVLESKVLQDVEDLDSFLELTLINEISSKRTFTVQDLLPYQGRVTNFITKNHLSAKRNYQQRATNEKPIQAKVAKEFGFDYWDGDRNTGYGGYHNDGRWEAVASKMIQFYGLEDGSRILDIGCGKGYLLNEFRKALPGSEVWGIDISQYAIENSQEEVRNNLILGNATHLPFENDSFDLVLTNMTLHNLTLPFLEMALYEIIRVGRGRSWIGVEAYTTEEQKWNLMRWQLTCESFFTPEEWIWLFQKVGYQGDYELIYFD